jgi:hypothetical protein
MIHLADARHPIRLGLRRGNKLLVGGEGRKASTLPDGVDSLADFGIHVSAKTDIGKQKQKCEQYIFHKSPGMVSIFQNTQKIVAQKIAM